MKHEAYHKRRQLTVGDLIVAVTEAAMEATQDQNKAYEIASRVLMRLVEDKASTGAGASASDLGRYVIH